MPDRSEVCVLVPTLNEAETIGTVIESFSEHGFENILVIDGDSTDGTRDIARDHGARVIVQSGTGKGQAVREALRHVEAPYILMLDGDATYRVEDAEAMLEPLFSGRAEHVIGDRFADMESGAMSRLNRTGNRIINRAFRWIHGRNLEDILSGYRAFTRESAERLTLTETGFGIETEMAVECVKHGVRTEVVPIRYEARPDESETNLHPFRDGATIILTLYQMAKTNNPLFYFGSVGALSSLVGFVLGGYVAYDWFVPPRTSHEVIAIVSVFSILVGVQLLIFGVLSDMIVALNREQTRRLEELAEQLGGERPDTVAEDPAPRAPANGAADADGDPEADELASADERD
ncbi:S-layer glycoprotein N-glycosyltransferase AglJ [Halorientalis regularis]|jgi:glycosyltransferase (TIGR04182 family)|uniref:Dolichol-phosphate mannosyltransferase n=1 Tax=Halorientalis regularis TaxID=660518 RepID=A0A1G7FZ88_9EURY|nr:S-layer glycoprotein N-glycosyltransferase AglJ [Halorientalis regularis]SDE81065.1 dolichol-phosphate mannosyltransferase [Halorientalis regularis]